MYKHTTNKLDVNLSLKPIKDLDISVVANRIRTKNISEQLDPVVNSNATFDTADDYSEFWTFPTFRSRKF